MTATEQAEKKKFAVLSLSPAVDRVIYLHSGISPGALNRAEATRLDAGSKGLNVARMLTRLGEEVEYYSFGGGILGDMCESEAKREIPLSYFTKTAAGVRENIKIIDGCGVCTELNTRAGPYSAEEFADIGKKLLETDAGYVCLCGSIPQGVEKCVYNSLITKLHEKGKICILDCDGEAMRLGIEAFPDIIKPNFHEAEELFISSGLDLRTKRRLRVVENPWENGGKSRVKLPEGVERAAAMCGEISGFFSVKVLCTMGKEGALSASPGTDEVIFCPAPQVILRGFAGAGDSFLGAYISTFFSTSYESDEKREERALVYAVAAGSAKVTLEGSVIPDRAAVERMMAT